MSKIVRIKNMPLFRVPDDATDEEIQNIVDTYHPMNKQEASQPSKSSNDDAFRIPDLMSKQISTGISDMSPKQQFQSFPVQSLFYGVGGEALAGLRLGAESLPYIGKAAKAIGGSGLSGIKKALAGYGGEVGKQSILGAGSGAISGGLDKNESAGKNALEQGTLGAGISGALTPIVMMAQSSNPKIRALGASLLGLAGGYGVKKATGTQSNIPEIGGASIGALLATRGKGVNQLVASNMLKGVNKSEIQPSLEASKRLGLSYITPAEASGSPLAGKAQGKIGRSEEGAELLYNKSQGRLNTENRAISDLLKQINPTDDLMSDRIRKAAQQAISSKKENLQKIVEPIYETAYQKKIAPTQLKHLMESDKTIENAIHAAKTDPAYMAELKDYDSHSIKVLDVAKRKIDADINKAIVNQDYDRARVLNNSKNKLIDKTDTFSKDYAKARAMFEEGSKPIERLENSHIGKISRITDTNIKNIPEMIFEPKQTDINVLKKIKKEIETYDPSAWRGIIKNEMERRIRIGGEGGYNFYKKILKNDQDYNQFYQAVEGIPGAQEKLADMRKVFKNLISSETARTATQLAKTSMSEGRGGWKQDAMDLIKNLTGGTYDKAAVELITNPQWNKEFETIAKMKSNNEKSLRLARILSQITQQGTNKLFNNFNTTQEE